MTHAVTRRDFLRSTAVAGAGLTIAFNLPGCGSTEQAAAGAAAAFEPNAFLRIGADNSVTVISKHMEMGQGSYTGLATILAEELDADWKQIEVVGAPGDASKYANLFWAGQQGTGGSSAIANSFDQMRKAGATARAMLVSAAAKEWGVPASEITVERGVVKHSSGKKATFGKLATKAAAETAPAEVTLKDRHNWKYIGQEGLRRTDAVEKSTGKAVFTQDMKLPGMLTALVVHPPLFGAKVKSFDAAPAKAVAGVREVVQIPTGVAVLGENFWAAKQGRDALKVEWDLTGAETRGSDAFYADYRKLAAKPGIPAGKRGDAERALRGAPKTIEASYAFPFLAHAAMEPMNCVVQLGSGGCELWYGAQSQTADQVAVGQVLGIAPEQVKINQLYAGGSFGRRAAKGFDYVVEAVQIAKAIGGKAPVKLVWTREDDMRAGNYRPLFFHSLRGALDGRGNAVAWHQRIVGQSVLTGTPFESFAVREGVDGASVEGANNLAYSVPNLQVELHTTKSPVTVQWWRSVGHTHTAFAVESFIDELATAAGQDPVAFRLALLDKSPRHAAALKLAADQAGWGSPLPAGKARGAAVHESFGTVVAEIAEVSLRPDKSVKVERVVCAVDCGTVINPDVVRAQMEGGIVFGLSAALYGDIALKDGQVQQSNFDGYRQLRISEAPVVEVHFVPSENPPSGVGEPGVPPLAPAVANAVYQLTQQRVRALPFGANA